MVEAILLTQSSHILFSNSRFTSHLSPLHLRRSHHHRHNTGFNLRVRCEAAARSTTVSSAEIKKKQRKSVYEIENLTTWLLKQEQAGHIDAELTIVLSSISLACKQIASLLQRSSIVNLTGTHGTVNIQGEHQKKLDVISNEVFCNFISIAFHLYSRLLCQFNSTHCPNIGIKTAMVFCNCLRSSGRTGIIASEEEDVPVAVEESYSGNYVVVFDPIDGSANIDTALTTGSIFGIYGPDEQCLLNLDDDSTVQFLSSFHNSLVKKNRSASSAFASPVATYWLQVEEYLNHLKQPGANGKPYSGRYIGCLVGEIHRMLLCGGVYGNPKNKNAKNGNLRLLYECAPMSYLVEQAGGKAIDGHQRILEIKPAQLGQEEQKCIVSVCQPGSNLLAAGYCLYSSAVILTVSLGRGVFGFTLDPGYGEFVLTHEDIKIPKTGKIYSFNEGNYDLWDDKLKKYLNHLKQPGANGKPYSGRYIGYLVGEIHRMLLCGGVYGNPKSKNAKNGNLRLLYECAPMSYLVEQAGGKAIDGHQRILEIKPTQIHQRSSIFIGSPDEIEKLEKYLA
ncbi:hypothetical protein TEA_016447 [Camellia sinensis var. sinensis]|uniref:fructose-bisphosphatase n=1 Tax=Camellia sinensis var. sinensis TaxID=542762 RepID=A0A4S4D0F0_CAMSN|nr:hypothetical protein TEA_016447 [Camellia sinensis var. sinensis]